MAVELGWRDRAACTDVDPELFFALTERDVEAAKAVCRRCPVRDACRQWADRQGITYGVWAEESEEERRARLAGRTLVDTGCLAVCEQCRRAFPLRRRGQRYCSHRCHHAAMARGVGTARLRSDCGTTASARRHRKRGEQLDDACRMAESLYRAQLRARRAVAG